MRLDVVQWADIADGFNDTLIVGNGGSIAFNSKLNYKSLYAYGCKEKLISEPAQQVFQQFSKEQSDFERVLYRLWQADFINTKFEVGKDERQKVRKAYTDVRRALINTVRGVHPDNADYVFDSKLLNIGRYLSRFSCVLSLNYDLIIYWALLEARSTRSGDFKDGWFRKPSHQPSSKVKQLLFAYDDFVYPATGYTSVYYPHGNLALYQTKSGKESKLTSSGKSLLETITKFWADNDGQPLFVCEGSSEAKMMSISSSEYLSHVFQKVLPARKRSVTIYGWGLGKQDAHILGQLKKSGCAKAAVSIYLKDKTQAKIQKEIDEITTTLGDKADIADVVFFDASSPCCWINP